MSSETILESLILTLPFLKDNHARASRLYKLLSQVARQEIERLFGGGDAGKKEFLPFGALVLPYQKMGAVDSLDLFNLDELIIFSFYWIHRDRYRHVIDIGANIGLHSIIQSKCGYEILAYEPDPKTYDILKKNLFLNDCANVKPMNAAVSNTAGTLEFVRVLGNTTGSHLMGSKQNPYGDLEKFPVKVEAIQSLIDWADLVKVDAEGHEKEILFGIKPDSWKKTDALAEIGTQENAAAIFRHFMEISIPLYSQKTNWNRVRSLQDMPFSHREGTLFISGQDRPIWET